MEYPATREAFPTHPMFTPVFFARSALSTVMAAALVALQGSAFADTRSSGAAAESSPVSTTQASRQPDTAVIPRLTFPLAGDFHESGGAEVVSAQGPHRFLRIGPVTGYHPTSLKTSLRIATDLHLKNEGSIALWVCPLETLAVAAPMGGFMDKDPNAQEYGLLADAFPNNNPATSIFAWYWRSAWHPQMIAKFKNGAAGGAHADFDTTPYVPVEHLPLQENQWYELVLSWNKAENRIFVYVNGLLCATTGYPFHADSPRPELFLGNTAMVFANLRLYDVELSGDDVFREWSKEAFPVLPETQHALASLFDPTQPKAKADWQPDAKWKLAYDQPLTTPGSFSDWTQQGCLAPGFALKELATTSEGLLIETPDRIDVESRVYFWSPQIFEGDLAVEFEFRSEKPTGLALLVVQASGMRREDFLTDHPPRTTGAMNTIITDRVRNYHWEFFRHSVDVRGDVDTQVLVKNPWLFPLGMSSRPLSTPGKWSKLLFVQEGGRLRAAIDGQWLLDVRDNPDSNNGPVFNSGRIGLRLMYQTRMRFRNLKVWNRTHEADAPNGT